MKIKTILLGILFVSVIYILTPLFLMRINHYLQLGINRIPQLQVVGSILVVMGFIIFSYCAGIFMYIGKGTPVPVQPPKKLVIKGLYKFVRNPMYLAHLIMITGGAMVLGYSLLFFYPILFIFSVHQFVIHVEEPELKKRFGQNYEKYLYSVPRWFPKLNI